MIHTERLAPPAAPDLRTRLVLAARRPLHDLVERALGLFRSRRVARTLMFGGLAVFLLLGAVAVFSEATLLRVDTAVQQTVIEARTGWLDTAMVVLTFLGTRYAIGALLVALVLWSFVTGRGRWFVAVMVVAFIANPIFEVLFKELVGRARPDVARLLPGKGPSFPSGHVLATVGFYGMLPLLVSEVTSRAWARTTAFFAASAVILTVAFSRVYLDVHWATDASAGLILGTVLVAAAYRAYAVLPAHGFQRVPVPVVLRTRPAEAVS